METAKVSVQRRRQPRNMTRKGLGEFLPTSVQKSYFLLSTTARDVLNTGTAMTSPIDQGREVDELLNQAVTLSKASGPGSIFRKIVEPMQNRFSLRTIR